MPGTRPEDVYELTGVSDPRIAPDGRRVAYQVWTIDREASEYLPHMYGAVNYTVVADVARLPTRLAELYRRLTT